MHSVRTLLNRGVEMWHVITDPFDATVILDWLIEKFFVDKPETKKEKMKREFNSSFDMAHSLTIETKKSNLE